MRRYVPFAILTSVFVFLFLPLNGLAQDEASSNPERNPKTPFRYVIVNGVSEIERYVNENSDLTTLDVLMEDRAFDERNLRTLFKLLSKRFTKKPGLTVSVYTSLSAILTPEENDGVELYGPVKDYKKFKYAFYNRNGFGEYFEYGLPGKKVRHVTIKKASK